MATPSAKDDVASLPRLMDAAVATAYGDPGDDTLRTERVPVPQPGAGQALVRVRAAGVNPLDWKVLRGDLRVVTGLRTPPRILGADLAGDIVALGPDTEASGLRVGDAAAGMLSGIRGGAYAEYVAVPVEHLAAKPEGMSYEAAGTLGVAGLTALQGIRDRAAVQVSEHVLVNGASGGVGHLALQLAKRSGATVTAVASGGSEAFVRALGADHFIDYQQADFTDERGAYDVVLDAAGNRSFRSARRALRTGGRYVTTRSFLPQFTWQALTALTPRALTSKRAFALVVQPDGARLADLLERIASGALRVEIHEAFPLSDAAAALRRSQESGVQGKLVLTM